MCRISMRARDVKRVGLGSLEEHGQPARPGNQPLPAPAQGQPGRLAALGTGGLGQAARGGQADPALDRLLGLPLVPRDGARVLRGRRDRRANERALRPDQGRPRGAPRRRRHLHGGGPGDDRPGRLAADRLPRPRGRARSTAAPTSRRSRARACRASGRCWRRPPAPTRPSARSCARPRRGSSESLGAIGRVEQSRGAARPVDPRPGDRRACRPASTRATAASAARPSSRPRARSSSCSTAARPTPVALTLDKMMHGGIYDQLGGGFARYSVDATWLVPHFEKMLYDNALLARVYLHGWQVTGEERWRRVCEETLDWALREMRGPEGGFYSALDADSEGEEGRFYVWDEDGDARGARRGGHRRGRGRAGPRLLGRERRPATSRARNILHVPLGASAKQPPELADARTALYAWRDRRVRPGLDDKRICSWNALMIAALADAGAALGRQDYLDAASGCARFIWESMRDSEGRLLRTWKDGEATAQRLPRGPRLPGRGAAAALRGDARGALVRRRPRDGRLDDRALRRRRARRLLHHLQRPRGADRPPQGRRRPPHPVRQLLGRLRPAAARGPDRRARLRGPGRRGDPPVRCRRPPSTPTPSATCCRRSTSTSPRSARSPWSRPATAPAARRASTSSRPSSARLTARTSSSPAARRAPSARSCCASAPPSRASRRPTSASTSPASPGDNPDWPTPLTSRAGGAE